MYAGSAAAAFVVVTVVASPAILEFGLARDLRREIGEAKKLDCTFGKEGDASKITVKLTSKDYADESGVFRGRIWMDKKLLFGDSIKFLYSKTEDGKASLGAGVLTQKRALYYTELFINFNPENGEATFEAATTGISATLQGSCILK